MTKKQEQILAVSLSLFANEGYHNTSTSKIAKQAKVSEGLIFRHFKNKEGLLEAILKQGQTSLEYYFKPLQEINDPKEIIRKIIDIPFSIPESEHEFWRLIYTLKWQQNRHHISLNFVFDSAEKAFEKLGYEHPKTEAEVLEMILDGVATVILLKSDTANPELLQKSLKSKYNL